MDTHVDHVDGPVPALALIASTIGYHLGPHREELAALGVGRAAAHPTSTVAA